MNGRPLTGAGVHRRAARLAMASLVVAGTGALSGCLIGAVSSGTLTNRFGRKRMLTLAAK